MTDARADTRTNKTCDQEPPGQTTIFYDGACPLCLAEVSHYKKIDTGGALSMQDVTDAGTAPPGGLSQSDALARFHVQTADGRILSGAAAFVAVWRQLPRWRWAARLADLPGALWLLERLYRGFLHLRPALVWLFVRVTRRGAKG